MHAPESLKIRQFDLSFISCAALQEALHALLGQVLRQGRKELQQKLPLSRITGLFDNLQDQGNERCRCLAFIPVDVIEEIESNHSLGLRQKIVLEFKKNAYIK